MKRTLAMLLAVLMLFSGLSVSTFASKENPAMYGIRAEDITTDSAAGFAAQLLVSQETETETEPATILQPGDTIGFNPKSGIRVRKVIVYYKPYEAVDAELYGEYVSINYPEKDYSHFSDNALEDGFAMKNLGDSVSFAYFTSGAGADSESTPIAMDILHEHYLFKGWEVESFGGSSANYSIYVHAVWEEDPANPIPSDEKEPPEELTGLDKIIATVKEYLVMGLNFLIVALEMLVEYIETGDISALSDLLGWGDEPEPEPEPEPAAIYA